MRLMSFALTTDQVLRREKTVTRRLGWANAKPGDIVQPVEKGQGLKKGEKVKKIGGPIRFVTVDRELLQDIQLHPDDCAREGFPEMHFIDFVMMFSKHNKCVPRDLVTRIEFEYLDDAPGSHASDELLCRVDQALDTYETAGSQVRVGILKSLPQLMREMRGRLAAEMAPREICICAALQMPDGYIVRGHRHDNCFYTALNLRTYAQRHGRLIHVQDLEPRYSSEQIRAAEQGFVTSTGRFVGRKEGMALMQATQQSSARTGVPFAERAAGDLLFSEDLY